MSAERAAPGAAARQSPNPREGARRRSWRRAWLVGLGAVAAAVVAIAAAASLAGGGLDCEWPAETERPLDLSRPADTAHLEADRGRALAIAKRFADRAAAAPVTSESRDAVKFAPQRGERAFAYCRAILSSAIAATHHVAASEVVPAVTRPGAVHPEGPANTAPDPSTGRDGSAH